MAQKSVDGDSILHNENLAHPHVIPGYLRPYQLAKRLQIRAHWLYDRIRNGTIQISKDPDYRTYLFPDKPETLRKFRQLLNGKINHLAF